MVKNRVASSYCHLCYYGRPLFHLLFLPLCVNVRIHFFFPLYIDGPYIKCNHWQSASEKHHKHLHLTEVILGSSLQQSV